MLLPSNISSLSFQKICFCPSQLHYFCLPSLLTTMPWFSLGILLDFSVESNFCFIPEILFFLSFLFYVLLNRTLLQTAFSKSPVIFSGIHDKCIPVVLRFFFFLRFNHVFEKESDIDRYPLPARAAEAQTRTLIQDGGLACCVIMLIHSLFLSDTYILLLL